MSNLLIDIGNSDIKTGTGSKDHKEIKNIKRFPYSKSDFKRDLEFIFSDLYMNYYPDKIGVSVLNSQHNGFMESFFLKKFKTKPVFINRDMNLPIRIDYAKGLGNDRICNAVAAADLYGEKNILVIDFGTATTFTFLSDNVLTGGLILPGIRTSLLSLTERTSLPEVKLTFPINLITGNTKDNIKAGILFQSLYSAERIIVETRKKYRNLFVIATGGYAKLIASKTDLINKTDRYLVLKGINNLISI